MKTKITLLLLVLYTGINCMFAQDIMTLKSGEEMEVIVTEVGKREVWYKKFNNPDGPVYSLPVTDIFMIKYPNGEKDVFTNKNTQPQYAPTYSRKDPGVACILSLLFPGGGQYYNGQVNKGLLMTGISVLSIAGMVASASNITYSDYSYGYGHTNNNTNSGATAGLALCLIVYLGNGLWSIIDAPISANKINEQNRLMSWNLGKKANLSVKPDINLTSYSPAGDIKLAPNFGAKLTLSLR